MKSPAWLLLLCALLLAGFEVPKLLLMDDNVGKPEGIHLVIGRRPVAAFGNSIGDKQMLEYTQAGDGARLMMLVHHDDATREFGRHLPGSLETNLRVRVVARAPENEGQ